MSEVLLSIEAALKRLMHEFEDCTLVWDVEADEQITGSIGGYPITVYISEINGWMKVTIGTSTMFDEIYQYGEDYTVPQGYHVHYCMRKALRAWLEVAS